MDDFEIIPSYDLIKAELDRRWENYVEIQTEPELQLYLREGQHHILNDRLTADFFEDLDKTLKKYKFAALVRLVIFIEFKEISEEGAKEIAKHISSFKSLQSFEIIIKSKIDDKGLEEIGGAISALKDMEKLKIEFNGSAEITDKGIEDFTSQISNNLPVLNTLSLCFRELENITDKGASVLSTHLKNVDNLRSLELLFFRCVNITDQGASDLATNISNDLKNLISLSISLRGCNKITDQSVKALAQQISTNLKNLQGLKLDFGDCHEITDQGMKDLAVQILNFEKLKTLTLWFTRCTQISDNGVRELGAQISDFLKTLQEFSLDVAGQITDQGLKDLVIFLTSNLEHLEILHLEVTGQVTDQGLKDIAVHLADVKNLQFLNLNFSGCQHVTGDGLVHARNLLKEIPNLTVL